MKDEETEDESDEDEETSALPGAGKLIYPVTFCAAMWVNC